MGHWVGVLTIKPELFVHEPLLGLQQSLQSPVGPHVLHFTSSKKHKSAALFPPTCFNSLICAIMVKIISIVPDTKGFLNHSKSIKFPDRLYSTSSLTFPGTYFHLSRLSRHDTLAK